eukprot:1276033-Pleurochrysis_carterae.AAC.2
MADADAAVAAAIADAASARASGNELFKAGLELERKGSAKEAHEKFKVASGKYAGALAVVIRVADKEKVQVRDEECRCRLNLAASMLRLQGYEAARREALAVLELQPENEKAQLRFGQACEALGFFLDAQAAFAACVKLNPSLREPREAFEALKSRLKKSERLPQVLEDLYLIEERALRALSHADLARVRQQLELMLREARANKEYHWECRALLGLAVLCQVMIVHPSPNRLQQRMQSLCGPAEALACSFNVALGGFVTASPNGVSVISIHIIIDI